LAGIDEATAIIDHQAFFFLVTISPAMGTKQNVFYKVYPFIIDQQFGSLNGLACLCRSWINIRVNGNNFIAATDFPCMASIDFAGFVFLAIAEEADTIWSALAFKHRQVMVGIGQTFQYMVVVLQCFFASIEAAFADPGGTTAFITSIL
jgi:hypothetical protein